MSIQTRLHCWRTRYGVPLVLVTLWAGFNGKSAQTDAAQAPSAGTSLGQYLQKLGYERLQLKRSGGNNLVVLGKINGEKRTLLVDTGCPFTTIGVKAAKGLKSLGDLGATLKDEFFGSFTNKELTVIDKLELGAAVFTNQPAAKQRLKNIGYAECILGIDFFYRNYCLFEGASPSLYVRSGRPNKKIKEAFEESMALSGFVPVELFLQSPGRLSLQVEIAETPARLMLDSGASLTVLNSEAADSCQFTATESNYYLRGINVDRKKLRVGRARLQIGTIELRSQLIGVADLKAWGHWQERHHAGTVRWAVGSGPTCFELCHHRFL